MHLYDIAAKVLIDTCRDEILRILLNIHASRSALIELLTEHFGTESATQNRH